MYRILCSAFGYGGHRSGVSEYIEGVVGELCQEHEVDLLIPESLAAAFPVSSPRLRLIGYPVAHPDGIGEVLWHHYILPRKLDFSGYDFCFLPAGTMRLLRFFPIPTLVTVHDLAQYHKPGRFNWFQRFYVRHMVPGCLRRAAAVMAISEYTRKGIIRHFKVPAERVVVNYNGFDVGRFYSTPERDDRRVGERYGLPEAYILYMGRVGAAEKGHMNLIKAYELLPARLKLAHHLVLAGELEEGVADGVIAYAAESPDSERIHFPGHVDVESVPGLFRNASLYVFPSSSEGFGIPLAEAMSCGIPAICSNRSSLPEIGGDAVLTFDCEVPEEIRDSMVAVLSDNALRNELIRAGYTQKEKFTWRRHVEVLIGTYERL